MNNLDFSVADDSIGSASGSLKNYRRWRRDHPQSEFAGFVEDHPGLDDELLIELASVDLIHRISAGHTVKAESYIETSPQFEAKIDHTLDLIDAEICARSDRGETIHRSELVQRFPDLRQDLDRLLEVHAIDMEASDLLWAEEDEPQQFGTFLAHTRLNFPAWDGCQIWEATNIQSDRTMTVFSWPRTGTMSDEAIVEIFEKRKQIRHPGLPTLVDFGFQWSGDEALVYAVVEPMPGQTLDTLLNESIDPFPERNIANWVLQILTASQAIHQALGCRVSVALDQAWVGPENQAKLLDFQELLSNQHSVPDADQKTLQSFGLLLFSICLQDSDVGKIEEHLNDGYDPIKLKDINDSISAEINSIYLCCVHPKQKKRYRTVVELEEDLKRLLSGKPVKATRIQRRWF